MPPKGESPPTVSQPTHIWSDSSGREAQENVAKRSTEPKGGIMLDPNLQALEVCFDLFEAYLIFQNQKGY